MPLPSRREVSIPAKDLIEAWLAGFRFDRFVTLAFNDPARRSASIALASHDYQEERLREWDARINRTIVGPRWTQSRVNRIWSFNVLEKPDTNPHWHLLLAFDGSVEQERHAREFDDIVAPTWKRLVPTGSVANLRIRSQRRVVKYFAKSLGYAKNWDMVIVPDSF